MPGPTSTTAPMPDPISDSVSPAHDGSRRPAWRPHLPHLPVFVERFGRRRRLVRCAALLLGCACAGYIAAFVVAMAGALQDPAGEPPPRLGEQQRSARSVSDLAPRDAAGPGGDPPASSADPPAAR